MTRRMADSITPTDIPVNDPQTGEPWALVAGYVDGRYAWSAAGWARFPTSRHVRIAVFPTTNDGDVVDCETGDATPSQAVDWVLARRAAGHPSPTVYCSYSAWLSCQNAFLARGVTQPEWWVAGYPSPTDANGNPIIPVGAVAHQFTDTPGGHWDESIVADAWPGVDPQHSNLKEEDVGYGFVICRRESDGAYGVRWDSGQFDDERSYDPSIVQLGAANGVPILPTTDAGWSRLILIGQLWQEKLTADANPQPPNLGTVSVTVPTDWKVTDLGGGVTEVKAV